MALGLPRIHPDKGTFIMAKKLNSKTSAPKLNTEIVKQYTEGAQKVWYAGIGAVARMQEEGEKLVGVMAKEARTLEAAGKKLAETRAKEAQEMATLAVKEAKERTSAYTGKVVELFEKTVSVQSQRVLTTLGIPTSQNIRELTVAIEQLRKNVESLQKARRAA
jgi:poly(hydroxyalkanoate) granule-associated protein